MIYVKNVENMGRGLFSFTSFKANRVIMECELLVLSEQDTKSVNTTDLQYYTFKYNDAQDCLVLGNGEIFNHSEKPNVGYRLIDYDGRKMMQFYTLTEVNSDDQLLIDYNMDTKVNTDNYKVNLT